MRIWNFTLREVEDNPLNQDFEDGFVNAESFDDAKEKVEKYIKTTWGKTNLEIVAISFECEVDIE